MTQPLTHAIETTRDLGSPLASLRAVSDSAPSRGDDLVREIDERVVAALVGASDSTSWSERLDAVLPIWSDLRVELNRVALEELGADTLRDLGNAMLDTSLEGLDDVAAGALRHAVEIVLWTGSEVARSIAESSEPPAPERLARVVEHVAVIELCWLTVAAADPPLPPDVAEAAAWKAYSRARVLRDMLSDMGIDTSSMPREAPDDAAARATAMLQRVCGQWSPEERDAFYSGHLPRSELLP